MFYDELFSGYNPGAFEGGATNNLPQLGGASFLGILPQLGGVPLVNQLSPPGGTPIDPYGGSGGMGITNYATDPLGGGAMRSGSNATARQMGLLGRLFAGSGLARNPRNWQQLQRLLGPMSMGRMRR